MKRFRRESWMPAWILIPFLAFFVVAAFGCNGDDDDGETAGPGGPGAFNFTEANMGVAAGIAIGGLEIIPEFAQVTIGLLELLFPAGGMAAASFQPAAVIPIGELDICLGGGSASLSLNDADGNYGASPGDSATLTFDDCDFEDDGDDVFLNGTVTLAFAAIVLAQPLNVDSDVTMNLTTTDDVGSEAITGDFGLEMVSPDLVDYTATFTAEDPDGRLRVTEGSETLTFGCFSIEMTFSLPDLVDGIFQMSPNAVVNANGKVFSINKAGLASLDFEPYMDGDSSYPDSGGMRFFSFVLSEGGCAAVGSPEGVGDSDESNFTLTALPGGDPVDDVTLQLFEKDNPSPVSTVNTNWSTLTD